MRVLVLLTRSLVHNSRVLREVETLAEAGHRLTVLEWARHDPEAPAEEMVEDIRVIRIRTPLMTRIRSPLVQNPLWWRAATRRALALHREAPFDAVHCFDLDTLPVGARMRRRAGVALLYNSLDVFPWMMEDRYPSAIVTLVRALEERYLGDVVHLFTANPRFAEYYRERASCPIDVIWNCAEPVGKYEAPASREFTVVYVGIFAAYRLFPEAVHALGDVAGVRLVLAGRREELFDEVRGAASSYDNVDFLGPVSADRARDVVRRGDIVLRMADPRLKRSQVELPSKVMDALAHGRPTLVTEGTYSGEFVSDLGAGIAVPYGAEPLRAAVKRIRDDRTGAEAMGRRGLEAARDRFNWAVQAEKLLSVYDSL